MIDKRQKAILSHLTQNGNVSVSELCQAYGVSEMTIRRDLNELQKQGLLKRTYGGAIPTEPAFFEMSQRAKLSVYVEEKERIGQVCATIVNDGDVVVLDSGTTTLYVAKALKCKSVTVITNDLFIASELLDCSNISLFVTGGELRRGTNNFYDAKAISFFEDIRGDILFLAVEGIDLSIGYTIPDLDEVPIKRKMIQSVRKTVVVSDHSKIGRNTMGVISKFSSEDILVTGEEAPKDLIDLLKGKIDVQLA